MPSTAEQIKSVILKHNGARKQQITRELNLGLDYVDLVCRDLERKGEIACKDGSYSIITSVSGTKSENNKAKLPTESVLLDIPKMTKKLMHLLEKVGYKTIESLADAPITKLMQETKLKLHEAAGLINQARKALNKLGSR